MNTFLTIDLDYWSNGDDINSKYIDDSLCLVPVENRYLCHFHQNVLPVANSYVDCDKLVNVDTHSDICGNANEILNCGTWVDRVKWRKHAEYHWYSPRESDYDWPGGLSLCDGQRHDVFGDQDHSWGVAKHLPGDLYTPALREHVVAVAVCLSIDWFDQNSAVSALARRKFKSLLKTRAARLIDSCDGGEYGIWRGRPKMF